MYNMREGKVRKNSDLRYSFIYKLRVVVINTITKRSVKLTDFRREIVHEVLTVCSCYEGLKKVQLL